MENRSHALWAGFFTIAMLCAAVFTGIWLNRDRTERVSYQIVTDRAVSGLNPQASVRYKGLAVGRVDQITFDPLSLGQININISIDPDTPVTRSTFATLGYQGVTGIAFVQLDDDQTHPIRLTAEQGQIPRIPLRLGLLEKLERSSTAILTKIELASDQLTQLFSPENQQVILGAFASTSEATQRWTKVADNLKPTVKLLPEAVDQAKKTLASVQELAQNATLVSQKINTLADPEGPLHLTLSNLSNLSGQMQADTLPQINNLAKEASNSMRTFNKTLDEINKRPQDLIFGKPAAMPGPGESGFVDPKK